MNKRYSKSRAIAHSLPAALNLISSNIESAPSFSKILGKSVASYKRQLNILLELFSRAHLKANADTLLFLAFSSNLYNFAYSIKACESCAEFITKFISYIFPASHISESLDTGKYTISGANLSHVPSILSIALNDFDRLVNERILDPHYNFFINFIDGIILVSPDSFYFYSEKFEDILYKYRHAVYLRHQSSLEFLNKYICIRAGKISVRLFSIIYYFENAMKMHFPDGPETYHVMFNNQIFDVDLSAFLSVSNTDSVLSRLALCIVNVCDHNDMLSRMAAAYLNIISKKAEKPYVGLVQLKSKPIIQEFVNLFPLEETIDQFKVQFIQSFLQKLFALSDISKDQIQFLIYAVQASSRKFSLTRNDLEILVPKSSVDMIFSLDIDFDQSGIKIEARDIILNLLDQIASDSLRLLFESCRSLFHSDFFMKSFVYSCFIYILRTFDDLRFQKFNSLLVSLSGYLKVIAYYECFDPFSHIGKEGYISNNIFKMIDTINDSDGWKYFALKGDFSKALQYFELAYCARRSFEAGLGKQELLILYLKNGHGLKGKNEQPNFYQQGVELSNKLRILDDSLVANLSVENYFEFSKSLKRWSAFNTELLERKNGTGMVFECSNSIEFDEISTERFNYSDYIKKMVKQGSYFEAINLINSSGSIELKVDRSLLKCKLMNESGFFDVNEIRAEFQNIISRNKLLAKSNYRFAVFEDSVLQYCKRYSMHFFLEKTSRIQPSHSL